MLYVCGIAFRCLQPGAVVLEAEPLNISAVVFSVQIPLFLCCQVPLLKAVAQEWFLDIGELLADKDVPFLCSASADVGNSGQTPCLRDNDLLETGSSTTLQAPCHPQCQWVRFY